MSQVTCISGIDTDIGKTVATGLMAKALLSKGYSVITQKVVQTGCTGIAEDIQVHRKLMGGELLPEDENGLTCPYVFSKACSPHLAAELEQTRIDTDTITLATQTLAEKYDHVLLEGAGGLMVPLTRELTFLDYIQERGYPLILVSSPRLGSVNHTLSALELAKSRGIEIKGIVYNCYDSCDNVICSDSKDVFVSFLQKYGFSSTLVHMTSVENYQKPNTSFDCLQLFKTKIS
ncbi:MAG TPA: ATP-dependent dethiobiotin synthetase BioD [Desulfocapsa sulfexigens]|nr:ATP-dependent dethiobiotin synthetase BioD [Desulfocapsa sulfexigens]